MVDRSDDNGSRVGQLGLVTPTNNAEAGVTVCTELNGDVLLFPSL